VQIFTVFGSKFGANAHAEDKSSSDAMARFPDSQIMKQIKLESELTKKYKADLAIKYDLTEKQLRKIAVEGATKGWPY